MGNRISKQKVEDIYALTPVQQGMLFHYLKNPGSDEYLEQLSIRLKGAICLETAKKAWAFVALCNESLRTVFRWDKLDSPIQIVLRDFEVPISMISLEGKSEAEAEQLLNKIREEDFMNGIDISENPFRIVLVELPKNEFEMIITNHHILLDGWSSGIIIKEFAEAYETILRGREPEIKNKMKVKEFIKWLNEQDREQQSAYWNKYMAGYDKRAAIPVCAENQQHIHDIKECSVAFSPFLMDGINKICRNMQVTKATVINTAWGILLQKYNNAQDVVFGTTVSGRTAKIDGIEDSAGLFINTLPLRIRSEANERIEDVLKRIEKEIREREAYESMPLVEIQQICGIGTGENIFDSLLVIENYPMEQILNTQKSSIELKISKVKEATNYDITVDVKLEESAKLNIIYKGSKYSSYSIERLTKHFMNILHQMIENSQCTIGKIKIIGKEEEKQLLYDFNNTGKDYPKDKTVYELFEKQAARTPEKIALVCGNERLTYRELNERANQLAWHLKSKGIKPDEIVGVMLERSIEMIVSILGILKAGGAYLPIDPGYPQKRIMSMLDNSDTHILITKECITDNYPFTTLQNIKADIKNCKDTLLKIPGVAVSGKRGRHEVRYECRDILTIDQIGSILEKESIENPETEVEGGNTIYQIYTSGSTGTPKGAMIKHHSFTNLINWYNSEFDINSEQRILLIASTSFDLAQKNLYAALVTGGQLHLFASDSYDYDRMSENIEKECITIINCTPSAFYPLLNNNEENAYRRLRSLRYVFLGGEPINMAKLLPWMNSPDYNCEIVNTYGPTECTDVISYYRIDNKNKDKYISVPIGRPIDNVRLYVLDDNYGIMPAGVEGELYAGGVCVGKGYYKNAALTKERFIEVDHLPDKLIYKTGDIAKWLPDGNIEFVGRSDNQVKIRGFRIETGEIESKLMKHKAVKEAIVIANENIDKEKYICAYLVTDRDIDTNEMAAFLKNELPSYMIPSFFIRMEKFPLTPSGKVDRNVLPAPLNSSGNKHGFLAPCTEMEKALADIWSQVLNIKNISIDDNFFEIGGHSIKAVEVINKVHKLLNIKITVADLFSHPTIRRLSEAAEAESHTVYKDIRKLGDQEYYELSYGQKRLWVLNRLNPKSTAYNIQGSFVINGRADRVTVEKVMNALALRHEGLRTRFMLRNNEPVQIIERYVSIEVPLLSSEDEREQVMKQMADIVFDLEKAPLISVKLLELGDDKFELLFCMHHIISDGWSMEILKKDFMDIYEAYKQDRHADLKPLRIQYKDYAAWQNSILQCTGKIEKAKAYWKSKLAEALPEFYILRDIPFSGNSSRKSAAYRWMLGEKQLKALKNVAFKYHTSLFNVLLTAYAFMFSDLSDQKDVAIGIACTARKHEDIKDIMGYFVNTVIVRSTIDIKEPFSNLLKGIHSEVMSVLEYQIYPLELIAQELKIKFPAIQLFFNMLNIGNSAESFIEPFAPQHIEKVQDCKFDIVLYVTEYANGLEFCCNYLTEMYKNGTIAYIMEKYGQILTLVSEDAESIIHIKSSNKKKRVLKRLENAEA